MQRNEIEEGGGSIAAGQSIVGPSFAAVRYNEKVLWGMPLPCLGQVACCFRLLIIVSPLG